MVTSVPLSEKTYRIRGHLRSQMCGVVVKDFSKNYGGTTVEKKKLFIRFCFKKKLIKPNTPKEKKGYIVEETLLQSLSTPPHLNSLLFFLVN